MTTISIGRFEFLDKAVGKALSVQYGGGHRLEVRTADWQKEYNVLPKDFQSVVDGFRSQCPDLPVGTYHYIGERRSNGKYEVRYFSTLPEAGWEISIRGRVKEEIDVP